jgi:hypothetical protein
MEAKNVLFYFVTLCVCVSVCVSVCAFPQEANSRQVKRRRARGKTSQTKMWPCKTVTEFRNQTSKCTKLKYFGQALAAAL